MFALVVRHGFEVNPKSFLQMSVVLCIPGGSVGRSVLCTGWLRLRCRDEARRLRDFRWVVEVSVSFCSRPVYYE